jgi:ABC-2 type transport system ATP-binding protein
VKPDVGSAEVFGVHPVAAIRAGRVGAMLQAGALLHDTSVRDLLRLMHGLHARPLPMAEIIERADVGSFWRTKTDKLSGGQAQRVRYALAIMPDPDLLILDEPTVGMDVEIRRAFWESMREFTSTGRTVLFATHYLDEADEMADRVVVLARGRVVADGSGAEIKSRVAGRTVGVAAVETVGARLLMHSTDSDATLRALLRASDDVRDVEVTSASLEDAFLALTSGEDR